MNQNNINGVEPSDFANGTGHHLFHTKNLSGFHGTFGGGTAAHLETLFRQHLLHASAIYDREGLGLYQKGAQTVG